jgi:hypothetical protein
MGETVDALVVGAPSFLPHEAVLTSMFYQAGNYGSGKRGGGVSALICAVLDDRNAAQTDEEPKYVMDIFIYLSALISPKVQHICPHRIRP